MDDCFWEELRTLNPEDVCRRSGAERKGGSYQIRILGRDYLLAPDGQCLRCADVDPQAGEEAAAPGLCFIAVHYLLHARNIPPSGELVGATELKGGKLFFAAGAHSPDFGTLEQAFSQAPQAVVGAAEALGGRGVAHGEAAVEVQALPRLPITFVFWRADEEFPASTSLLFDRTADRRLPLDVVLALAQETMRRLVDLSQEQMARSG